uniref:Uncharacterized protein n=1 Tax=Sphaerodactylus townsendi TaxID=933632 RepID=A0ACB8FZP7_9SAUR
MVPKAPEETLVHLVLLEGMVTLVNQECPDLLVPLESVKIVPVLEDQWVEEPLALLGPPVPWVSPDHLDPMDTKALLENPDNQAVQALPVPQDYWVHLAPLEKM